MLKKKKNVTENSTVQALSWATAGSIKVVRGKVTSAS